MNLAKLYAEGKKFESFCRRHRLSIHSMSESSGPYYIVVDQRFVGKEGLANMLEIPIKEYDKAVGPYGEDNMSPTAYLTFRHAQEALWALYEVVEMKDLIETLNRSLDILGVNYGMSQLSGVTGILGRLFGK